MTSMLGAIAGDIIGSTREHYPVKTLDFELFPEWSRVTDDSVIWSRWSSHS